MSPLPSHPHDRLMVALDFHEPALAKDLVARLGNTVGIYKIGLELIYGGGLGLFDTLKAAGKQVFLDAKLLDIGHTVERATRNIARLGADFLTVHAMDRKTLDAAVAGRGTSTLKLLAVTVMTHLTAEDLQQQGIEMAPEQLVLHRAHMAQQAGFDGVVASGQEAAAIRDLVGPEFLIVTPGIRPAGAAQHDQSRIVTPADAIAAGANYLVVGRPITQAPDPLAAAQAIQAEIAQA